MEYKKAFKNLIQNKVLIVNLNSEIKSHTPTYHLYESTQTDNCNHLNNAL